MKVLWFVIPGGLFMLLMWLVVSRFRSLEPETTATNQPAPRQVVATPEVDRNLLDDIPGIQAPVLDLEIVDSPEINTPEKPVARKPEPVRHRPTRIRKPEVITPAVKRPEPTRVHKPVITPVVKKPVARKPEPVRHQPTRIRKRPSRFLGMRRRY